MEIYCHGVHKQPRHRLCGECRELLAYAALRTDRCPFMATKTFCSACRVHCYTREKQEKIRAVMRYAGPENAFCPSGAGAASGVGHTAVKIGSRERNHREKVTGEESICFISVY